MARRPADPVTAYARAVTKRRGSRGRVVAGELVRLASRRHLDDLARRKAMGWVWDEAAVARVIEFFSTFLWLVEVDRPFVLTPWQQFVVGSLFGWKLADGSRRFRLAYIEVGKGNGKTPMAAGVGLYGLTSDQETSAEVYSAATTREQANILFSDAVKMVKHSEELQELVEQNANNLSVASTFSFFRPLSSEHRGLDGRRVHMALIDEVHEHPTPLVVDKMRAGTKGRRQSLIFEITNSGYDQQSVCFHHHEYSEKILRGALVNESWFAYVCQLDEGDRWSDPKVWIKANPNLGTSIPARYLQDQVDEALGMPSKQNIVRRLNFCEWTSVETLWIDLARWQAGQHARTAEHLAALTARPCWVGVDLSSKIDLSAVVLVFPPSAGEARWQLLVHLFMPAENLDERGDRDRAPYREWAEQGLIELTPGNRIDQDRIRDRVVALKAEGYQIQQIGIDPWNAANLAEHWAQDGFEVVEVPQTMNQMSEPSKMFEAFTAESEIDAGANPAMQWMVSNAVVVRDTKDNLYPTKKQSRGRIDGLIAAIIGIKLAQGLDGGGASQAFEERGLWA